MSLGRRFGVPTNSLLHRFLTRRYGRRDGRVGLPRANEPTPSEQERQLLARGDQHMSRLGAEYAQSIRQAEATLSAKIEYFRTLLTAFKDESKRYDQRRAVLNRSVVQIYSNSRAYVVLFALIALGEFALNAQAFEVFDKPMLLTALMALAIAVLLPAVAHFCGIWIRQWPPPAWRTGVYLLVASSSVLGCLVAINNARISYLDSERLTRGPQSDLLDYAFLAINIFVFVGSTLLSYFGHDPDYELQELHKRVSKVDRKLDSTDRAIYLWDGKLEGMIVRQRAEAGVIRAIIHELVSIYREANRLARSGEEVEAFRTVPEIAVPEYINIPLEEYRRQVRELREARYKARSGSSFHVEAKG